MLPEPDAPTDPFFLSLLVQLVDTGHTGVRFTETQFKLLSTQTWGRYEVKVL